MALSRKFRPVDVNNCQKVPIYNNISGLATQIDEGDAIYISGGAVVKCVDANTVGVHGIACADIAASAVGEMWIQGLFEATVTGTIDFALGGAVYSAASSAVDDGSSTNVSLGHITGADYASGVTTVQFVLSSLLFVPTTHA